MGEVTNTHSLFAASAANFPGAGLCMSVDNARTKYYVRVWRTFTTNVNVTVIGHLVREWCFVPFHLGFGLDVERAGLGVKPASAGASAGASVCQSLGKSSIQALEACFCADITALWRPATPHALP